MAEEQQQGTGDREQGTVGQQGQQEQGQKQQGGQPGPVPYERFKQVNEQLATLRAQVAAQGQQSQQQQQPAGDADLARRLAALEQDLAQERANTLRLKVARAAGLPDELADRLNGANEAELAADAAKLVPLLKSKGGPGVPPPSRGGSAPAIDISKMNAAEIRKARAEGKI